MENITFLVALIIVIIVIVAMVIMKPNYDDRQQPPEKFSSPVRSSTPVVSVTYQNKPMLASKDWFINDLNAIKADIVKSYSNLGSAMCQEKLKPALIKMKESIRRAMQDASSQRSFCNAMDNVITTTGHQSAMELSSKIKKYVRSDSNTENDIVVLYEDIISHLNAIREVVVHNICSVDGRVNLDLIYSALDTLANICDVKVQAGLIQPNVDWVSNNVVAPMLRKFTPPAKPMHKSIKEIEIMPSQHGLSKERIPAVADLMRKVNYEKDDTEGLFDRSVPSSAPRPNRDVRPKSSRPVASA